MYLWRNLEIMLVIPKSKRMEATATMKIATEWLDRDDVELVAKKTGLSAGTVAQVRKSKAWNLQAWQMLVKIAQAKEKELDGLLV